MIANRAWRSATSKSSQLKGNNVVKGVCWAIAITVSQDKERPPREVEI
ncbi:MAG: hypothetical protein AAGJ08_00175 [Cyanobacteria bacterium P01_H01_bin.35]